MTSVLYTIQLHTLTQHDRVSKSDESMLKEGDIIEFQIKTYKHVNGVIHIDGILCDE